MNRPVFSLLVTIVLASVAPQSLTAAPAELAHNPLIWADVPDISVMRVGKTYYMSSTTMHMSPGLPIMKSEDLVNWRMASYAHENLVDNEDMRLENGKSAYSKGSWASSLRSHDGVFYVSTFSANTELPSKLLMWSELCSTTGSTDLWSPYNLYVENLGHSAWVVFSVDAQRLTTKSRSPKDAAPHSSRGDHAWSG